MTDTDARPDADPTPPADDPATLHQRLETMLQRRAGAERLVSFERLSGGASQETYRLIAVIDGMETPLALRRAPGGETGAVEGRPGLAVEAQLMIVAGEAGVPEPTVYAVLEPDDDLGDGFVMEWLDGETLGARINRSPALDAVRPGLAQECGRILATIHGIDPKATGLADRLEVKTPGAFLEEMVERYQLLGSPQPMIDFTAHWLADNLPEDQEPKLVHNDFRNGNVMVGPDGVMAVLDWEVAHLGDPMRDLGWICTNSWRFGQRDKPVGGFGDYADLFAGYEEVSGRPVDPDHVRFWEVFGSFWWAIGCLSMAERWRTGPDATVERPGIARRSSECQVDCVNLLIPGPVEVVTAGNDPTASSSTDMPTTLELLVSVRDFLRTDVMPAIEGRTGFMARVASNSLDIVRRELELGPPHRRGELARLRSLLGAGGGDGPEAGGDDAPAVLVELRRRLIAAMADGTIALDDPALHHHLRTTVVNQVGIDQPVYSGYRAAVDQTV
ncbi:MAG: phosphotransferase family protein [Acidimicrobiales bacterium]